MGFRLEGPALAPAHGTDSLPDFISDATPLGSIQVPASGQPIVLMADRQTTGGYPTIATVITADVGVAGQLGPGDSVFFVVCSLGEAMAALVEQERALKAIEAGGAA
jgi:antagonist of KipI